MKISIIHPSRGRPFLGSETMNKWISRACNPEHIEYILSLDSNDPAAIHYSSKYKGVQVIHNPNQTAIEAINVAAKMTKGNIIVVVSDDFDCPQNWDRQLLRALDGRRNFCAKAQDGHQSFIITLPIMDREYYNSFGYVYYPEYQHMFCDTEMSCVAWITGRYIPINVQFKHNHYSVMKTRKDAINIKNDATWPQGERLFVSRRRMNFGLKETVQEIPDISGLNIPRYR